MAKRGTREDELDRARKKALQLLRIRLRSTAELRDRLSAAGFDIREVEAVVVELQKAKVLDDAALAEAEVRRMKERGPAGAKVVRARLTSRGLDAGTARDTSGSSRGEVWAFATKKYASMPSTLSATAKARRLFGMLARRGIDEDLAGNVVAKLTGVTRDEA